MDGERIRNGEIRKGEGEREGTKKGRYKLVLKKVGLKTTMKINKLPKKEKDNKMKRGRVVKVFAVFFAGFSFRSSFDIFFTSKTPWNFAFKHPSLFPFFLVFALLKDELEPSGVKF